jgi:hypothetical protein
MLRFMSTVLRPVGPEPAQTYWIRRVAVVGAVVVVLAVIGALIANGTSSGSAVQASPPPPTLVAAQTPSPTPSPSASPEASASLTAAQATVAAATTAPPTTAPPSSTAATTSAPPPPAPCPSRSLRPTLTGKQLLKPRERNTFTLSLINGSGQICVARVTRDNFELKIYSGIDRIWSTKDCATIVKAVTRKLGPEQAMEWSVSWNGRRSRTGCQSRPEIPRPGTYYATAQVAGAEPVKLRMTLAR